MNKLFKTILPKKLWPSQCAHRTFEKISREPRILDGPFRGMHYVFTSQGSALIPKLLGIYEKELHTIIKRLNKNSYKGIYVIGAGEGYYAVGMALKHPNTKVLAYEANTAAHDKICQIATRNGVIKQIEIRGCCEANDMKAIEPEFLVIMDVEGAEEHLLNPVAFTGLAKSTILFEAHFSPEETQPKILRKFASTHFVTRVDTVERSWRDIRSLPFALLFYIRRNIGFWIDEMRGGPMQWYLLSPRAECSN
jgi:precorrin-6B methylase 2